jgi:poly(U)-specific endoribonuclease
MDTAVMKYTHQYLLMRHKTTAATREQFIVELNNIWFGLYRRKVSNDSSGFEHVFLGEIDADQVKGISVACLKCVY